MQIDISLAELKSKNIKNSNKIIGLCHGCFDIIHFGHIKHFESAKSYCDYLFVSVTSDRFVSKGQGRPYNNLFERMIVLNSIKFIDYVFPSDSKDAKESLEFIKPNYFFKGSDYSEGKNYNKNFDEEKKLAKKLGCEIFFTKEITSSSTKYFNKLMKKSV